MRASPRALATHATPLPLIYWLELSKSGVFMEFTTDCSVIYGFKHLRAHVDVQSTGLGSPGMWLCCVCDCPLVCTQGAELGREAGAAAEVGAEEAGAAQGAGAGPPASLWPGAGAPQEAAQNAGGTALYLTSPSLTLTHPVSHLTHYTTPCIWCLLEVWGYQERVVLMEYLITEIHKIGFTANTRLFWFRSGQQNKLSIDGNKHLKKYIYFYKTGWTNLVIWLVHSSATFSIYHCWAC